jgi:hypothetical protein
MSSLLHVPQLAIPGNPPPDPMEQYGKLLSIQKLSASQDLQKAQIQNAQLDTQAKQLEVAQQQRDAVDQQATQKAYQDSGGDPQKFMQLLPQYGASYKAALTAKTAMAAQVEKMANSDEATFKAHKEANGLLGQQAQEIINAPPEDQAALYTLKLNQIKRDPVLSKYAQGFPQQYPGPDGMKTAAIGLGMNDALIKQADEDRKQKLAGPEQIKADADAKTAVATATLKQGEVAASQNGGAVPGIPLNVQQANDWLKKHPDKTISDYVPPATTIMQGNLLGASGQGSATDQAAERYSQTGELPQGFSKSPGTTAAIIKRSAELHPDQSLAANKSTFGADTASLKKLQTNFDQVSAFESTAGKNLDLFLDKLNQIPDLKVKFLNTPLRLINDKMIGTDNYQAMKAAQQTASAEAAKVLSSANASGVLSDSQKKEAEDMLSGNLSYSAAQKVVGTLKQDFANRHVSYQQDIDAIKQRLNPNQSAPNAAPQNNAAPKILSQAAIQQAAKDHGVSVDEATKQAKAAGYTIQ